MTQDPGKVLPSLLTAGVIVRSTRKTFSVTFHDAKEASSAVDRQVANWIKEFERAPRSETNGVSDAQVEALFNAMETVCRVGGSTGRSMKQTFLQGFADLGIVCVTIILEFVRYSHLLLILCRRSRWR